MSTIEELYAERNHFGVNHNDIWEHMGTLRRYGAMVTAVCEIGTRTGNSTTAFLAGLAEGRASGTAAMRSFDIEAQQFFPPESPNVNWQFIQADTHQPDFAIPRCELLFIDGCHKYESVKADLRQAERVWRYIILHDTSEERDRIHGDGVCQAMGEFLHDHPEWQVLERFRQLQRVDGAWEEVNMPLQFKREDMPKPKDSPWLNRRGRFKISRSLLRQSAHEVGPVLFGLIFVLEAQMKWESDCVEYLAIGPMFNELTEGISAPLYEITFAKSEDGTITMSSVEKSKFQ